MSRPVCAITGANRGIGLATAEGLARAGCKLVLVCRDLGKGEEAKAHLEEKFRAEGVELVQADLDRMDSVRRAAQEIARRFPGLSVLVNNAGLVSMDRLETVDGYERTFAVNHLAPFLLTNLLRETLAANAPSRVVTVSSEAHRQSKIDLADLQLERDFHPLRAYGRSKLANILFTYELSRRWKGSGITANCLHPGVVNTGLLYDFCGSNKIMRWAMPLFLPFSISTAKGAATSVYLASADRVEGVTGRYYVRCRERKSNAMSYREDLAHALWERSAELTHLAQGANR